MATTLNVSAVKAGLSWSLSESIGYATRNASSSIEAGAVLSQGTGAGKASKIYVVQDDTGITGSGTNNIDLQAVTDAFDNAISFSLVKYLVLQNTGSTANLVVSAATTNGWAGTAQLFGATSDEVKVAPKGWLFVGRTDATGYPVSATQKQLLLTNAHTSVAAPYKLIVIGE